jgi:hypothetical protein
MRMKELKAMFSGRARHVLYLLLALAMLVYALPRLELGDPLSVSSVFGYIWVALALLVVTANVNELLLMDEEKRKELARIKRAKYVLMERKMMQRKSVAKQSR